MAIVRWKSDQCLDYGELWKKEIVEKLYLRFNIKKKKKENNISLTKYMKWKLNWILANPRFESEHFKRVRNRKIWIKMEFEMLWIFRTMGLLPIGNRRVFSMAIFSLLVTSHPRYYGSAISTYAVLSCGVGAMWEFFRIISSWMFLYECSRMKCTRRWGEEEDGTSRCCFRFGQTSLRVSTRLCLQFIGE